jgi:hypothetical protein
VTKCWTLGLFSRLAVKVFLMRKRIGFSLMDCSVAVFRWRIELQFLSVLSVYDVIFRTRRNDHSAATVSVSMSVTYPLLSVPRSFLGYNYQLANQVHRLSPTVREHGLISLALMSCSSSTFCHSAIGFFTSDPDSAVPADR